MSLFGPTYRDLGRVIAVTGKLVANVKQLNERCDAIEAKQAEIDSRLPYKPFVPPPADPYTDPEA